MKKEQSLLVCLITISCLIGGIGLINTSNASATGEFEVDVDYDSSTGILTYSGTSDSDIVNVIVNGTRYHSPLTASIVSNGHFSDILYLGSLDEGEYTVSFTGTNYSMEARFSVGLNDVLEGITIDELRYDEVAGTVYYSGTSTTSIVNVRVYSDNYTSPYDACIVNSGFFSDTFYLGILSPGTYHLEVSSNDLKDDRTFVVGSETIVIGSVTYEGGILSYAGTSNSDIVNVIVLGNGYSSVINATFVVNGVFEDILYLGDLEEGTYTVRITGKTSTAEDHFTVGYIDPYSTDSIYSPDGKTLIEYHGTTSRYVLPDNIEVIADGAFDNASITTFVMTKDVVWNVKIKNNTFPMQNTGITELVIQDGVTVIPDYLFACTDINDLIIPASIEFIGVKSFYLCENLSSVTFENNNHLTVLDQYSFGSNSNLSSVHFGSSSSGYSCSIEKGGFFDCGNLIVTVDSNFNLYSIGEGAFANDRITMLIGDEQGDIIHIPGTVGYLGKKAFSEVNKTLSVDEPGKNTLRYNEELLIVRMGPNGSTGRSIIFEDNYILTKIEMGCFSMNNPVDSIDLSRCHNLLNIEKMAFAYCLDSGSTNIALPDKIQTIGAAAFECRGQIGTNSGTLVMPASLERLEAFAFEGICGHLSFENGSKLNYFDGSSASGRFQLIDLSTCFQLEELGHYCDNNLVRLPIGVYSTEDGRIPYCMEDTQVATIINGELRIEAHTVGILAQTLPQVRSIFIDDSNRCYSFSNNTLYVDNGYERKIVLILDVQSYNISGDDYSGVVMLPSSIGPTIKTLRLGSPSLIIPHPITSEATRLSTVYIDCKPTSWSIFDVFSELRDGVTFYVTSELDSQEISYLKTMGTVYVGHTFGNSVVYLPTEYNGSIIDYHGMGVINGCISVTISIDGRYPDSLDLVAFGANCYYDRGEVSINNLTCNVVYLRIFNALTYSNENVTVTFEGNGGHSGNGEERTTLSIPVGSTLDNLEKPVFIKNSYVFVKWVDEEGREYSFQNNVNRDIVLTAIWESRAPLLFVDQSTAFITANSQQLMVESVDLSNQITFVAEPRPGYELLEWVLNGAVVGDAKNPLTITELLCDSELRVTARYYSPSTGMNNVNNRDMPTSDEVSEIIRSYVLGGFVNTDGTVWTGMVSIPLVVDEYVYVRIADRLYKVESDTGYIVKSVESLSKPTFYHYLGYGGGVIIDYNTSRVYDLDLNQLYVLDSEISSADYYNGKFYVLSSNVYSFTSVDDNPDSPDEIKTMEYIGKINNIYGSYGIKSHEFVNDVVYCVTNSGDSRGIVAFNLLTGETNYKTLESLNGMYLDDGWLTYYNGYIFLTAYSEGLFGAVATPHGDRVAYVPVDGMVFGEERYYQSEEHTFSSRFVFYGGRAFVSLGGALTVFELPGDMTNLDLNDLVSRSTRFVCGHGNFVIDVSHIDEDGSPIYAYGIPYDTHHGETLWIAVDRGGLLSSTASYSTEREWNSQAVRSDIDGRMLWYNDSGWLYSYTTSDKNVYYFFIEDGDSAIWYRVYGANAADALASLGDSVATLNAAKIIQTVNGHPIADGMTLQMLKATYGTTDNNGQFNNLDQYSWVNITNLGDTSYSLNHYFRIICGNGSSVTSGDVFTYMDDGETKTYTFTDNIGDRSIIGKQLSRGTDVVYIRFVEDNTEIPGTASIVKRGSEAKVHFPEVVKVGYIPIWKNASGEEVADIYGQTFSSDATFYLSWQELPAGYIISGTMDVSDGVTTWSADVDIRTGIGTTDGLSIKVTAVTSDGRVLTDIKTTGTNGLASGSLNAANIRLMYIRIVDEHVEGNLGYVMIEREATA